MPRYDKYISQEALSALKQAEVTDAYIRFDFTMSRETYEEVKEIFVRMRGIWRTTGKKMDDGTPIGQFTFADYKPTDFMPKLVESGEMPPSNPTDFYPTPKEVVKQMLRWAELPTICDYDNYEAYGHTDPFNKRYVPDGETHRVLEPSAGVGGIAEQIRHVCPEVALDVVEFLPINAAILRGKGFEVKEQDFLTFQPPYKYNTILMNPPFAGTTYIDHVTHAWHLLKQQSGQGEDYGALVAILPTGWMYQTTPKIKQFRKLVTEYGYWEMLPKNTFKDTGTNVDTVMVMLTTESDDWRRKPYSGYDNNFLFQFQITLENGLVYLNEKYVKLFRALPCNTSPTMDLYTRLDADISKIAQSVQYNLQGYKTKSDSNKQTDEVDADRLEENSHIEGFRPQAQDVRQVVSEWIVEGFKYHYAEACRTESDIESRVENFKKGWELYLIHKMLEVELIS